MNALIRWDSFRGSADVHGRLSSILGRSPQNGINNQSDNATAPDWYPVADLAENDGGYVLKVEIPGVREDAVSVRMEGRRLSVQGEREQDCGDGLRYLRMERAYGAFCRAFQLPGDADPNSVEARFKRGVLEIYIVKNKSSKPQPIGEAKSVKAGRLRSLPRKLVPAQPDVVAA